MNRSHPSDGSKGRTYGNLHRPPGSARVGIWNIRATVPFLRPNRTQANRTYARTLVPEEVEAIP
ncbi:hypothetical protein D9623_17315 [Azospirillum brasilense]|uniref:Uncharacterized protein n=1 Tax=Azospirillum brasilense TaxID=192 RepID=A0A4D8QNG3_AZOBR|nr:hypothetical protein [Azospirillum brasilense]QCO10440.1 hypothetical protein D3868_15145 [Azospirillum brasilense]QEL91888.1 hypothetical protein D9621_17080 [Azospirillum brasilense]QEL98187.1 hypothetical protein D9623_17315 [Azospirillum brasilense]